MMGMFFWLRDRLPLRTLLNWWPPFLGAGIYVEKLSEDYRYAKVVLKMHWYNPNYVKAHFGGSIYAMTDPFLMLMLMKNLGHDYIVWDKAAKIEYKKPGKGKIFAVVEMSEAFIVDVKKNADEKGKYIFDYEIDVRDEEGDVVATTVKTLYVRKKGGDKT